MQCDSNHFVMPDLIRHPVDLWPSGEQFIILLDTGMRRYDGLCRGIRNSYSNYFVMPDLIRHPVKKYPHPTSHWKGKGDSGIRCKDVEGNCA